MKLTKEGIVFVKGYDLVTWIWPWKRIGRSDDNGDPLSYNWKSAHLNQVFKSLNNYYYSLGKSSEEYSIFPQDGILGMTWDEVLYSWITANPSTFMGNWVILWDLDLSRKTSEYWAKFPPEKRVHFSKDIVCLSCKDSAQAFTIAESINKDFGKAVQINNGNIIGYSEDY